MICLDPCFGFGFCFDFSTCRLEIGVELCKSPSPPEVLASQTALSLSPRRARTAAETRHIARAVMGVTGTDPSTTVYTEEYAKQMKGSAQRRRSCAEAPVRAPPQGTCTRVRGDA